jgi:hypothetical protein
MEQQIQVAVAVVQQLARTQVVLVVLALSSSSAINKVRHE